MYKFTLTIRHTAPGLDPYSMGSQDPDPDSQSGSGSDLAPGRQKLCHSPPGCVIPRPAVSFPARLCHSPPGCDIPRPAVSFPARLCHSPPGCVRVRSFLASSIAKLSTNKVRYYSARTPLPHSKAGYGCTVLG
jgi:hypothetical protein